MHLPPPQPQVPACSSQVQVPWAGTVRVRGFSPHGEQSLGRSQSHILWHPSSPAGAAAAQPEGRASTIGAGAEQGKAGEMPNLKVPCPGGEAGHPKCVEAAGRGSSAPAKQQHSWVALSTAKAQPWDPPGTQSWQVTRHPAPWGAVKEKGTQHKGCRMCWSRGGAPAQG